MSKGSINKNIVAQIVGKVLTSLCGLIIINHVCRYLSISEFGNYSLAFSFLSFSQPIVELGMNIIAIRDISRNKDGAGSLLLGIILAKIFLAACSLLLTTLVVKLLGYDIHVQFIVLLTSLNLFVVALGTLEVVFIVNGKMGLSIISQVISILFQLLCILSVIRMSGTVYSIVLSNVLAGLVGAAILYLFAQRYITLRKPQWSQMTKFIVEAFPQGVASIITGLYYNIDAVLLSRIAGAEAVAYYGTAYRILGYLVFVPHAMMMVFLPILSRNFYSARKEFQNTYSLIFFSLMFIAVPLAMWISCYAEPVICFIYAPKFAPSAIVLKILVWAGVAAFASHLSGYALVSINRQRFGVVVSSVALVVNVGINLILIPKYGIVGAAISTLITEFLVAFVSSIYLAYFENVYPINIGLLWVVIVTGLTWLFAVLVKEMDWKVANMLFVFIFSAISWQMLSKVNKQLT